MYAEELGKYGYVKIKGRHPYFVRMVGDEIIHIMAYQPDYCLKQYHKRFDIIGGVATVYTGRIDPEESPRDNLSWFQSNAQILGKQNRYNYDDDYVVQELKFLYKDGDEESMMEALRHSLEMTKKHLLPTLDKVQTLKDCVEYCMKFDSVRLHI